MPSTRAYVVRRLDSVEQEVVLLKKALGSECLDRVSRKLIVLYGAWSFKKVDEFELVNYRKTLQRCINGYNYGASMYTDKILVLVNGRPSASSRSLFYVQLECS